jgi:hypothetical protein
MPGSMFSGYVVVYYCRWCGKRYVTRSRASGDIRTSSNVRVTPCLFCAGVVERYEAHAKKVVGR